MFVSLLEVIPECDSFSFYVRHVTYSHNEYGNDISIIHMEMIFPYEMWEWDSNITYGNVIPILYMGMSFQLQIPISYMGILFPHEIGEWPTIINVALMRLFVTSQFSISITLK